MIKSITLTEIPTPQDVDPSSKFVIDNGVTQTMISVDVILQCLRIAERQGDIPSLPQEWWFPLMARYQIRMDTDENIQVESD
ncbi:hypothetical protein DZ860_16690 [Vibrio sinensis]|uniref:Uncharacterized protein n=1 Tax=Vibrio sinensis TaxID=2302434 RepID=A0A3A6QN87_9VIBR|nr:hypothetical protein [Vibrio sinensis]RJX68633.1 hypothetical protein DZ860_16690 [Vibrio sinensis]